MRTIWQSLIWKEWHEHKWKLVSLTAILWSIAALGLFDPERGTLIGIHVALVMAIVPLAIFIGLGSAAGERSRGTLAFLQALPVPMWRVAVHKVAIGVATIIVPALLTVAFVFAWIKLGSLLGVDFYPLVADVNRDFRKGDAPFVLVEHWYANSALTLTLVASGFYLWTIATGVNRKDEVSAGAVALTVIMAWCVILLCVWSVFGNSYFAFSRWPVVAKWLAVAGVATAPGGLVTLEEAVDGERHFLLPAAYVTGFTMFLLAAWYVRRFGQILNVEIRSPKAAEIADRRLDWLGPPRRSPFTAVAWKQFRESGPLAVVGVAVVLAVCTVIFIVDSPQYRGDDYGRLLELFAAVSFTIGLAVAMIVGIGVFLYDVGPGLNTFWRSRPINPDAWFWTKYLSGLAVILAAIYGPVILVALPRVNLGENILLVFPTITVAVFAAAAAMTCLVRNAVYAAILSIAVVYLGFIATAFSVAGARILRSGQWPESFGDVVTPVSAPQAGAGMLFTFLLCTLAAWLSVRNDWGKKSRY